MSSNLEMPADWPYRAGMENVAEVAAALGDPTRLRILDLLVAGRAEACCSPANPTAPAAVCACDLAPVLGGMAPSKLAYHMGRLRKAGLVTEQRRGKWVYYSIDRRTVAAFARSVTSRWSGRPRPRRPLRGSGSQPRP
ncbi:MAG: helix-turn-helix domain-containing protein [Acidobacteriia bacterium]|nr:helix-turn-helix domain-containing protein [Terriglobia bacterium]